MKKMYSNKTIQEVSERSGTQTEQTPNLSANVSPYNMRRSNFHSPNCNEAGHGGGKFAASDLDSLEYDEGEKSSIPPANYEI